MAKNTPEYAQLLMMRGALASLSPAEQQVAYAAAETIRGIVRSNGVVGMVALAVVGAEVAADEFPSDPAIIKETPSGDPA